MTTRKHCALAAAAALLCLAAGSAAASCRDNGNEWVDVSSYLSDSDLWRMPKNGRFCWQGFLCTRMFGDTVYCQLKGDQG